MAVRTWTRDIDAGAGDLLDETNYDDGAGSAIADGDVLLFTLPNKASVNGDDATSVELGRILVGADNAADFGDESTPLVVNVGAMTFSGSGAAWFGLERTVSSVTADVSSLMVHRDTTGTLTFHTSGDSSIELLAVMGGTVIETTPMGSGMIERIHQSGGVCTVVGLEAALLSGSGSIVATGGTLNIEAGSSKSRLDVNGATVNVRGTSFATVSVRSGTCNWLSTDDGATGNITTALEVVRGTFDATGVRGPWTIKECLVYDGEADFRCGFPTPTFTDGMARLGTGTVYFDPGVDSAVSYL